MFQRLAVLTLALAACGATHATSDAGLATVVDQRLRGDRTGACFAVAVIDGDRVARTFRCADPADSARIGPDTAFEIGSVAKTMNAALLADLVTRGEASLDDRLGDHLPQGTRVPTFEGQPILLRHIVTHTSGLPSLPPRMDMADPSDPYATLDATTLLASLADIELERAPGSAFEYSNFATMLLSLALARHAGSDLETLLDRQLFTPLGMEHAWIEGPPPAGVRMASGHSADGRPVPAWTMATDLSGAGNVRATLDDVVRYVQAHLELRPSGIDAALQLTREPLALGTAQPMAMNWLLVPHDGRFLHAHEGATGGFTSFVGFDTERKRGVVVLSDTEQHSLGGLGDIGLHLVDSRFPLGAPKPALVSEADSPLAIYAGTYPLMPSFAITVRARGGALYAQATGQQEFPLEPSGEDAYAIPAVGAELHFLRDASGAVIAVELHQGGHVTRGDRQ